MTDHLDDEAIDDLLTGRLPTAAREAALRHARECEPCSREVTSTQRLLALADALPRAEAPDSGALGAITARLAGQRYRPIHRDRHQLVAAGLLLAFGAFAGAGATLAARQILPDDRPAAGAPAPATSTFEEERDRALLRELSGRGQFIRRSYDSLRAIDRQLDSLEFLAPPGDSAVLIRMQRLLEARHFYWREVLRMIGEPID